MTDRERYAAEIRSIMRISGVVITKKEPKKASEAKKPAKRTKKEEK